MDLNAHPTIRRLTGKASEGAHQEPAETVLDAAWLRQLASDCGADDAGLVEIARPGLDPQREEILRNYPWTKSLLSLVLRMAREPFAGAPVGGQPRISPDRPRGRRGLRGHRGQARGARGPGGEPLDGLPHGDVSNAGACHLGRRPQAGGRRGRPRPHGDSPQRDPPEIRQLRPAGDRADRSRDDRIQPPDRLQSVPRMQAVRRRLSGRGDRAGGLVQFLVLLHPQLSRVPGRLHRLG